MRKLLANILVFVFVILIPASCGDHSAKAFAESEPAVYTYGDYDYTLLDDGTVEIVKYTGRDAILAIPSELDNRRVASIGDWAFSSCSSLTEVIIPDGVTSIGDYAFYSCGSLTEIIIPDSVTSVGINSFGSCANLSRIYVSPKHTTLATIDGVLFDKTEKKLICYPCSFTNTTYEIPYGIISIGIRAFENCQSLTEIIIPDSITSIEDYAFCLCRSLTKITIPDSVTSIGNNAFHRCNSLTEITIPDSVTTVGANPFIGCDKLGSIYVSPEHTTLAMIDGVLFDKTEMKLIYAFTNATYEIPHGIISIGSHAFDDCRSLTEVIIPDSVTSIGDYAFNACTSLTEVIIPDGVTSIGDRAFNACTSLTEIIIPDSITSIGDYAFNSCLSLTEVTIPGSVTSIGASAFEKCNFLTLTVEADSYAEKYAVENNIFYTYPNSLDWLNS